MSKNYCVYTMANGMLSSYSIKEDEIMKLPTLHRFVWKGKTRSVLKYLSFKEKKIKVNKKDWMLRTPIHLAASRGDFNMLQLMLSIDNTKVNNFDIDGASAFFKASQILSLECMKELRANGANIDVHKVKGYSLGETLIKEHGDLAIPILSYLIYEGKQESFMSESSSYLHAAVSYGHIGCTETLLEAGADVNAADKHGKTVLMEAMSRDYFSIAQFLLKNKADIYSRDGDGKDVKSYAANSKRCLDLIESYDHMKDAVDKSSRNQVFVVTRNNSNNGQTRTGDSKKSSKILLEEKLEALRREIEHRRNVIVKEKEINQLLKQQPKELAQQSDPPKPQEKDTEIHEEPLRPKVLMKKLLKSGYTTKEEWVKNFDMLVDKYDELQRAFDKLLLVESDKELEIEENLATLKEARTKEFVESEKVQKAREELQIIQQETNQIKEEKDQLNEKIRKMELLIPEEKKKFKEIIQEVNKEKNLLLRFVEKLKLQKNKKLEELDQYVEKEKLILKEIDECDIMLQDQATMKMKIVNKIKSLKIKCSSLETAGN